LSSEEVVSSFSTTIARALLEYYLQKALSVESLYSWVCSTTIARFSAKMRSLARQADDWRYLGISCIRLCVCRRLKADLQYLRRRGLLKASGGGGGGGGGGGELSHQGRKCARCSASFGRFYNIGTTCMRCRHRVCRQCRIEIRNHAGDDKEVEWICNVCYKIA